MRQKLIGNTDISVCQIGLGCMGPSEFYGPATDIALAWVMASKDMVVLDQLADQVLGMRYKVQGMQYLNG